MTRYDDVEMDPRTGLTKHPLAGVPQSVLDAATKALTEATKEMRHDHAGQISTVRVLDSDDVEAVAHAVLLSALEAWRSTEPTREDNDTLADWRSQQ